MARLVFAFVVSSGTFASAQTDGVHTIAPVDSLLQFTRVELDDRFLCEGAITPDRRQCHRAFA